MISKLVGKKRGERHSCEYSRRKKKLFLKMCDVINLAFLFVNYLRENILRENINFKRISYIKHCSNAYSTGVDTNKKKNNIHCSLQNTLNILKILILYKNRIGLTIELSYYVVVARFASLYRRLLKFLD